MYVLIYTTTNLLLVEFVLNFFNVQNNFTPEEEAELQKDNDRAFENNNLMSCL